MDYRKIGFGLGAFAAGAAAWTAATAAFGPKPGARRPASSDDDGVGAVPGDSTTSPVTPRPATMAAAPVGMAETEKHFEERAGNPAAEHVPTDLMGDTHPGSGDRAAEAFRPDPTAVPTDAERESLRPATGPAPTLVADRGSGFSEAAGAA
ncbi:hypothetical protein M9979_13120 [Sphingomonas sp. RP10(2022)]|uniref:Extensin n=1 Tax=Sphingomonas liriopis TaxID=2949094 RepID=A0A9X2HX30_9SPHN|nr:hypothetical protein [Sphingomonas liriopis]MCP3735816.1 hypothetical protein [Sphingomonas liriopis]